MVSAPNEMLPVPFGRQMRDTHFSFAKEYTPLNHGSYGATPICVRRYQQDLQDEAEARADRFLRQKLPKLLVESRAAVAPLLGAPLDEVVFVLNATTGVNTVLRNLDFEKGDVILYFSTIYDSCEKTVEYICESTPAESLRLQLDLPMSDIDILAAFENAVSSLPKPDKRVKLALIDTVLTFPGVKMPWERLVERCAAKNILSLIDGAHGIGHIDLTQLGTISPDFFTSNCYKWLFTPRGSAVFYVPKRNHHLLRSSLPTSHGFQHAGSETAGRFADLFAFVGTQEMSPLICVPKALDFREKVCGGEDAIRRYCTQLAQRGGARVVDILGTRVMRSDSGTLQDCCFATIQLPLVFEKPASVSHQHEGKPIFPVADWLKIANFINAKASEEHDTFIPVNYHAGHLWARLSAQIYLDEEDFVIAGEVLKRLCEAVENGKHESSA